MRDSSWLVEINLISNHLLEYVPDPSQHPFPEYLRIGVPVCLNTDDRGWWHSNMTDEHYLAVTQFNLSWAEIMQITKASIEHSFAQPEVKARLLANYEASRAEFEKRFGGSDWHSGLAGIKPVTYGYAARQWGLKFP
jgi:adenosine deaminase CECR1